MAGVWPVFRSRPRCVSGGCGVDGRCVVVSQQSRMQFPVIVSGKMRSGSWFLNNLARNSLARLSNIEIESLELQRLWRLLNCQANELRAKFLTRGLGGAGSGLPRRSGLGWGVVGVRLGCDYATGRWSLKVSEKVRAWRGEQGDSRDERMSLE